jgi:8-oxo-dGTP pyrophosphatase MutT (NUDIX family)/GNAT superfamily N-acetyltransferase
MSTKTSFITPHCISAYVVCKTLDSPRYLLIRRCGKYWPGTWQVVTGGIENGETAGQAALREIREETGLIDIQLYSADSVETFYMQDSNQIAFAPVFVGFVEKMDVQLSPSEHDAFEWMSFENAKKRLGWAEQKRVITLVHECCVLQKPNDLLLIDILHQSKTIQKKQDRDNDFELDEKVSKKICQDIVIRPMHAQDISRVADLYLPWSTMEKTTDRWQKYYEEQRQKIRTVAVVEKNDQILGYGSLLRRSEYPHFSNIPEISDVWIYEKHRRQGIGKQLLSWLEKLAHQEGYAQIGIGVGLYQDYGPAQNLYFQLGYKPDGRGITYKHASVVPGESYPVDDDLIIWMTKPLRSMSNG